MRVCGCVFYLGRGRSGSSLCAARTSSPRSLRDRRSRSLPPCCDTGPGSGRGWAHRGPTSWEPARIRKEESLLATENAAKGSGSSHQSQSGGEPRGRGPGLNQASDPVRRLNKAPPSRPSRRRDTGGALAEATATSFSVYTEAAVKMAVFI